MASSGPQFPHLYKASLTSGPPSDSHAFVLAHKPSPGSAVSVLSLVQQLTPLGYTSETTAESLLKSLT